MLFIWILNWFFNLFNTLFKSVIFYGVEAWVCVPLKCSVEKVYAFLWGNYWEYLFFTPLNATFGKHGRLPLFFVGDLGLFSYSSKLLMLSENRLAKLAYEDSSNLSYTEPMFSLHCMCHSSIDLLSCLTEAYIGRTRVAVNFCFFHP